MPANQTAERLPSDLALFQTLEAVLPTDTDEITLVILLACLGSPATSPALAWLLTQSLTPSPAALDQLKSLSIIVRQMPDGHLDLPTFILNRQEMQRASGFDPEGRQLFGHYLIASTLAISRRLLADQRNHYQHLDLVPIDSSSYMATALVWAEAENVPPHQVGRLETFARSISEFARESEVPQAADVVAGGLLLTLERANLLHQANQTLKLQIPELVDVIYDREPWLPEDEAFFYGFLIPLLQLCYQVLQDMETKVAKAEPLYDEVAMQQAQMKVVLEGLIDHGLLSPLSHQLPHPPVYPVNLTDVSWTTASIQQTLAWIKEILSPRNWKGKPAAHTYIHLNQTYPLVPKLTTAIGDQARILNEFGATLIFPHNLTPEETRIMWNDLAGWYDEQEDESTASTVAWEHKKAVFQILLEQLEFGPKHHHLDLCCGPGNLKRVVPKHVQVSGIDISEKMLEKAAAKGMQTKRVDLNHEPIPLPDSSVDSVTISFGEMWLDHAFVFPEIWRTLRPGGKLVFNVYAPKHHWRTKIKKELEKAGFDMVTCHTIRHQVESNEQDLISKAQQRVYVFVVSASKPRV